MTPDPWGQLAARIQAEPVPPPPSLDDQPEPVRRYLAHAVGPEARWAPAAHLEMRGRIRIGRWLPFKAEQLLAPRLGTVWRARVGGLISGSDRYVDGEGAMAWKLLGLIPVARGAGPDVSRSAAGRAAGESVWVPTALPPGAATWQAEDDDHVSVRFTVDGGHELTVHHELDASGALRTSSFRRWGDPDETGEFAEHRFGVEVTGERTFRALTIPAAGRVGWHLGTDRWPASAFFEFEMSSYRQLP